MEGNQMKIIEALKEINRVVWDKKRHTKEEVEAHRLATEAMTAPPRNCDVGTAEEQQDRFLEFCKRTPCDECAFNMYNNRILCEFAWAQMPYDEQEGGAM